MYVAFNLFLNPIHVREIAPKSESSVSCGGSRREGSISVDYLTRQRYQCEIGQKVS